MNYIEAMADEPENLTLHILRAIQAELKRMSDDMGEVKVRLGSIERGQADMLRQVAGVQASVAEQSVRIDRMSERLDRVERSIGLITTDA